MKKIWKVEFDLKNVDVEYDLLIKKMQSYIKVKGEVQIGSLIQHTKPFVNDKVDYNDEKK